MPANGKLSDYAFESFWRNAEFVEKFTEKTQTILPKLSSFMIEPYIFETFAFKNKLYIK